MTLWVEATKEQAKLWLHEGPYPGSVRFIAKQLVNSDLMTTREYWREKMGVPTDLMDRYVVPADANDQAPQSNGEAA